MQNFFGKILILVVLCAGLTPVVATAQTTAEPVVIHVFKRDDCTYCKAEVTFLNTLNPELNAVIEWHDITTSDADNGLYQQITVLKRVPRITPITIIGDTLIQGFDAPETTGKRIEAAIIRAQSHDSISLQEFIANTTTVDAHAGGGCNSDDVCTINARDPSEFSFKLPVLGVVDLRAYSLGLLSIVLGVVDGFNPCAMWVLITFLLVLLQVGDRKKMFAIAGTFILAEAVMYGLILNVWYTTWDFVGLDQIVTPLVGALAIASGIYFLYKWYKSRHVLVCDATDIETQGRITKRIEAIAKAPLTIAALGGILAVAFSVNIIEFACSIGIPQAYTKILELNQLSWLQTQWYTLIYIVFYMIDDIIVFALALWGFEKIHSAQKYSRASMLIGGLLMLALGVLLAFYPNLLTL